MTYLIFEKNVYNIIKESVFVSTVFNYFHVLTKKIDVCDLLVNIT